MTINSLNSETLESLSNYENSHRWQLPQTNLRNASLKKNISE